jgi:hypothetical protein
MSIYRVHVRRHTYPRLEDGGLAGGINWLIPDAVITASERPDSLREHLSLRLQRDDYLQAVNEIAEAVQRLGYNLLEIEISELVDQEVKAMIFGTVALGGAAHSKAKNPWLTAFAALAGGYLGHWAAAQMKRYEVAYRFSPSPSGWTLAPVETARS